MPSSAEVMFLCLLTAMALTHVVVASGPLVAPVIMASPSSVESGQTSTLSTTASFTGGTSPYSCQWSLESPGDTVYSNLGSSFSCDTSSLPSVSTGILVTGGTWNFRLQVTDSSPATTSSSSVTVTVNPSPVQPTISLSPKSIDAGQDSTLTTTKAFSGGTSPYTCQWLQESPGAGSYTNLGSSFACTTSSLPTASTGTLSSSGVWNFELSVTDAAPVTVASSPVSLIVNPVLGSSAVAPSPAATDTGRSVNITVTWSGGTSPYSVALYSDPTSSCSSSSTSVHSPWVGTGASHTFAGLPPITSLTWYCAVVTDGSPSPESQLSPSVSVTVNPALVAPAISVSPKAIDKGQNSTLTVVTPIGGGTSPYLCQWIRQAPGKGFIALGSSFACTTSSLPTTSTTPLSSTGTWNFALAVTDGASVTKNSNAVSVTVSSTLLRPTINAFPVGVSQNQSSTLNTKRGFSGGSSPYTCQWLQEPPGSGAFSDLGSSFTCVPVLNPSTSTGALTIKGIWFYELKVTDGSGGSVLSNTFPVSVGLPVQSILSVSCSPSRIVVGAWTTCGATALGLTPTGSVLWVHSGTGKFSLQSCTLSAGHCSVRFNPWESSLFNVTARYLGDRNNLPSSGVFALNVTQKSTLTFLSCKLVSMLVGRQTSCTATVRGYIPTGAVNWSQVAGTGTVTFSSSVCTLSRRTQIISVCTVEVTGEQAGSIVIQAAYGGDPNNFGSAKTRAMTIV